MRWETLIHETVQMGGSIVFLAEDAPLNLTDWLRPFYEMFSYEIPVVKRRVSDFFNKTFCTKPEDLVVVFASQKEHIANLNFVLQGQRLLLSEHGISDKVDLFDFFWDQCQLSDWLQMLHQLRASWFGLSNLADIKNAHESPCVFLDRDDVVVKNIPYNNDPSKVELIPGIERLISSAHGKGYWVSLVSNQSGLGRGWISWLDYQKVHQRMLELLAQKGCWLDECVWASYIDEESIPYGRLFAGQRKPRNGMFQMVNSKLKVNMAKSIMIGDSASDLVAAFGAGVGRLCLFQSEKIEKERIKLLEYQQYESSFEFEIVEQLSAVQI
ncbi:MAG: HAD-IIIA family hydrolase [Pseudobdellovibrionaceae bacterium]